MVWPILISVSLAPGPYWPAANASPPARTRLVAASPDNVNCFLVIDILLLNLSFTASTLVRPWSPKPLSSSAARGRNDLAKQLPSVAVELLHLHLFDRS